jgi:prevent-host-death family protein
MMTEQHSIAQARQNLAALVRKLEKQVTIEITRRGKTVAVLLSLPEFQRLTSERKGFWEAYTDFRHAVNLADLQIEADIFNGVRSSEPGRDVDL